MLLLLLLLSGTECTPCIEESTAGGIKKRCNMEERGGGGNIFTDCKKKNVAKIFRDTRAKARDKHTGLPAALNLKHSNHKHSC